MRRLPRATRGSLAFLTRLPVAHREGDWAAFRRTPAAFVLVGWLVGALAALPLLLSGTVPAPTVAFAYLLALYLLTGIHHLDGVADLGDALVAHGDAARRREVLKDTTTGVGALLAVAAVIVGVALAGLELATLPIAAAVGIVVAAEVGAKLGMAGIACLATAAHEGMGSQLTATVGPAAALAPAILAAPAVALTWPAPAAGVALLGALGGAAAPAVWASRRLEGVTGDIFGAANELARLAGLHLGVIAWTLS